MNTAITLNPKFEEIPDVIMKHMDGLRSMDGRTDEQIKICETIQTCRIHAFDELHPARPVLSIIDRVFMSLGDFSLITGKAKSRKTFLLSLFIAALVAQRSISNIIPTIYPGKKRIIWIDTEQSKYHTQKVFKRVLKLAGVRDTDNIEFYSFRGYSPGECKKMVQQIVLVDNPNNDILMVVIDGLKDLVNDINDPKEATAIVTWLMQITDTKETHICTILHQNKGENNNARGHVGTEGVNKAQSVISVEKDDKSPDFSIVRCMQSRDMDFDDFAFKINDDGLPVVVDDYLPPETKGKTITTPQSFDLVSRILS